MTPVIGLDLDPQREGNFALGERWRRIDVVRTLRVVEACFGGIVRT